MEAVNGVSDGDKGGPPPPSPLTGCYLLIVIGEPHCNEHKDIILQRVAKGLLSWDLNNCLVDLEKELGIITEQALEGEEARYGERLIQFASENLVTEILIHPVVSTLAQCVRNLLSSFTRHRHIIHAGYTFANNGSWVLQDGTFSSTDFWEAFQEIEVLRVIRAYENGISLDLHCAPEGDWTRLPKEPFAKGCKVRVNPNDFLTAGSPSISSFINYLEPFLVRAELDNILESSDVVGNIRFSRPTLYVFPGGQGDAALFGINGFNMLLDGGFSRKACFWDFVRHLDRLDAVLLTRLNNSNVNGISAVLRRKRQNALYPQVGHFFCNIQERKAILSPDGDKDKDPLLINLLEEGQDIVSNLRHLSLIPQVCYRDSEPINLYHKVGHGTLDMYVLSPAKDSKEVREFLQKWNNNDQKLFANVRTNKEFVFPLQNLVSICALLVWQPANPEDTITRILFPGSSPQNKIFEGLDKIKSLEFIKHPVCSEKSLAPTTIIKAKQSVIERIIQPEKKIPLDNKKEKVQKPPPEVIDTEIKNGEVNGVQPTEKGAPVKKSDSTESEKSISKPKKIIENGEKFDKSKSKPKYEPKNKPRSESQQRKVRTVDKKPSPTTPKRQVDKADDVHKPKSKPSPTSTPAKSAKEANNRKVVESKIKSAPPRKEPPKPVTEKKEVKVERKPISRRPKDISKLAGSPSKKVNGVQKPDSISRRGKLDKEGTTDSSTVSTPSAEQDSILKKDISKLTTDEIQNLKAQELADLKEEQEAVKEIEAVFRKGELQEDKPSDFRKIKDLSIDDKLESEEYLIIEKTEIEQDLVKESNKEEETQKIARDSEESEKQRKLSEEKESAVEEKRMEIQDKVQKIITSATDIVKAKEEVVEASKEVSVTSPEDKIDISTDKKDIEEIKEIAQESQPDEKGSANIESGATTTAPTLPEDERMPLDEIKEDNGDQIIEEKHVKEDTKEKDIPVIQLPPKTFENIAKLPPVVGIRLDKQSHIRDIVKTPDEVADLPVHEEVEFDHYDEYPSATETKSEQEEIKKEEVGKNDAKEKTLEEKEDKKGDGKQHLEGDVQKDKTEKETLIEKDVAGDNEKTDVVVKDEDTRTEIKEEVKVSDEKTIQKVAVESEGKAVISEDLNKKELSKSPDEEKDTDEHELEHKKEELVEIKSSPQIKSHEDNNVAKSEIESSKEEMEPLKTEKVSVTEKESIKENQQAVIEEEEPVKEQKEVITDEKEPIFKDEKVDIPEKKTKPEEISKIEPQDDLKSSEIKKSETPFEKEVKLIEIKDSEKVVGENVTKIEEIKKDDKLEELDKRKESLTQDHSKTEEVIEKSETEIKEKDDIKEKDAIDIMPDNLKQTLPEVPKDEIVVTDISKISESTDELKLKEDVSAIHKIEEKLQKLKDEIPEVKQTIETKVSEPTVTEVKKMEEFIVPQKEETQLKQDASTIEKIDEKLQKLKDEALEEHVKAVSEVVTHKTEEPQHAEPVVITTDSLPESPVDEKLIEEKIELGRKSPKEREEDVALIVASVAEVLKSDAPLEEFEGKIPFSIPYKSYTTELRETHITTVESPVSDEVKTIKATEEAICPKSSSTYFIEEERKIAPIHEEQEIQETKISKMIKDSNELMQATSKMIQDIKYSQPIADKIVEEPIKEEQEGEAGTVHRMLVTASSEDGGEETEICPPGTITFSRSSESSGRSSPDLQSQKISQKSSTADTFSESTVITKSVAKDEQPNLDESKVIESSNDVKEEIKESQSVINKAVCDNDNIVEEIIDKTVADKLDETKDTLVTTDKVEKDEISSGISKQVEDAKQLSENLSKEIVEDSKKQDVQKDSKDLEKDIEGKKIIEAEKHDSERSKSPEIKEEKVDIILQTEKVDAPKDTTLVLEEKKTSDDIMQDDSKRGKSPEKLELNAESKDIPLDLGKKSEETVEKKIDMVLTTEKVDEPKEITSVSEKIRKEPAKESIASENNLNDKKTETIATEEDISSVSDKVKVEPVKEGIASKEDLAAKKLESIVTEEEITSVSEKVKGEPVKEDIASTKGADDKKSETIITEEETASVSEKAKEEPIKEDIASKEGPDDKKLETITTEEEIASVSEKVKGEPVKEDIASKKGPDDKKLETITTEEDIASVSDKVKVESVKEGIASKEDLASKKLETIVTEEEFEKVKGEPVKEDIASKNGPDDKKLETITTEEIASVSEKVKGEPPKEDIPSKDGPDDKKLETITTEEEVTFMSEKVKGEPVKEDLGFKEGSDDKEIETIATEERTKETEREMTEHLGKTIIADKEPKEVVEEVDKNQSQAAGAVNEISAKVEDGIVKPPEEIKDKVVKIEDALSQMDDLKAADKKLKGDEIVEDLFEKKAINDVKAEVTDIKKVADKEKKSGITEEETSKKDSFVQDLTKALTKEADTVLETVKETIKKTETDVDTKVTAVAKEVEEKRSFLGELVNDIGESLLRDTSQLIEGAEKHVEGMKDSAKYKIEELKEDISIKKGTLDNAVEDFKDSILKETSAVTDTVKSVGEASESKLNETEEGFKKGTEKLLESGDQLIDSSKSKLNEINEAVTKRKEEISEKSTEVNEDVIKDKEKLFETVKDFEETLVNDAKEISEEIKSEASAAKKTVEEQIKDVKQTLMTQKETVAEVVTDIQDSVSKDIETKIEEAKGEVAEAKEKSKSEIEEMCKLAAEKVDEKVADLKMSMEKKSDETKEAVDESKKMLEETKDKIVKKATSEIKDIEKKADTVLEQVVAKEDSIVKGVVEDVKQVEGTFEEKKEKLVENLEHLTDDLTKVEISLIDSVGSASSFKKEPEIVKEGDSRVAESKYDLYNGLESVEKMVVDVLTADRKDSLPKSESDKRDDEKIVVSNIVDKVESDVESIVGKGIAEVQEFVEESKEAIKSIFKGDSAQEDILEKSAHGIEENYEVVSDMTKSIIFEKCDETSEEDHKSQEKQLEESAQSLEKDYQLVTDMAKSIEFEKCEKPLSEGQKEKIFLEKTAKDVEENYNTVSDMTKSIVFEKCEKPLTEEQKEEIILEKSAKAIEDNYKTVSDIAQSVVFDKCETPKKEDQSENDLKPDIPKESTNTAKVLDSDKIDETLPVERFREVTSSIEMEQSKTDGQTDSRTSGKSSPEKLKTDEEQACKVSGKSSPTLSSHVKDFAREGSGKSTPDLKDTDHIKVDNQDSLLSGKSSPGFSGKSSPIVSGRSSPGAKAESKDSLLSGKSSPEHTKPDSKESSLSGTSSPALSSEIKADEKEKAETLTTEVKVTSSTKSSPAESGKTSPVLNREIKADSGKTSPEFKTEKDSEVTEVEKKKDDLTKGKVSPAPQTDTEADKISSQKDVVDTLDKEKVTKNEKHEEPIKMEKIKIEQIDTGKVGPKEELHETSQESKEVSTKVPIREKKTETEKDKTHSEDLRKISLEIEESKENKLSVSDVQISVKLSEEEKVTEKSTSDFSKSETPEDTKHLDEKVETKDVDSIDSGIGTEVEAKLKKSENVETLASSVEQTILKDQESSAKPSEAKEESIAGPSAPLHDTSLSPAKASTEDLHLSGKSTPDIAEVEKMKEIQETFKVDKHIPGSSTPPTVPVSPIIKELSSTQAEEIKSSSPTPIKSSTVTSLKDSDIRSCTPGSDDYEIGASTHSDISSGQVSRAPQLLESDRIESDEDDDVPGSPMSVTSQVPHSRSSSRYDFEDERIGTKMDPMNTSFYGALPDEDETELDFEKAMAEHRQTRGEDLVASAEDSPSYLYEVTQAKYSARTPEPGATSGQTQLDQINKNGSSNVMTASFIGDLPTSTTSSDTKKDVLDSWGKPLGLPSPAPPNDNRGTPKKERKLPSNVTAKNKLNDDKKRSESPSKYKNKKLNPVYVDLTYVPHHGNSYYSYVDFFKRVRARYYVFSGIEPSREVYNALLEAKQTWEDKELEVTIIPTYDTDILGYWVAENEELLTKYKIDLSPSASRCTINLQDHETSCSAYRLEF